MEERKRTALLVDGYSLLFRAFHALPLLRSGDVYTNAVQGFFSMLFKAVADYRPDALAVMMDMHAPTFRHAMYDEYKAGRKPMPEEMRPQIPLAREILNAMGVTIYELEGYEADDLLGTASRQAGEDGWDALILTGDRDCLQLAGGATRVIMTKTGISESRLLTAEGVEEAYGYTPEQVTDMKGLMGDASDNIPGVAGVGEKTALKLLGEYKTLENTLAHADEVKGKLGEKLRAGRDAALLSKKLATINRNAPVQIDFDRCGLEGMANGMSILKQYGLNRLAQSLAALFSRSAPPAPRHGANAPKESAAERAAARPMAHPAEIVAPVAVPEKREAGRLTTEQAIAELAQRLAAKPTDEAPGAVPQNALALYAGDSEITLCEADGALWRMPILRDLTSDGLYADQITLALKPALERAPLIVHDQKALMGALHDLRMPPPNVWHDTMLGAYLLQAGQRGFGLRQTLASEYGAEPEDMTAWDVLALALRQRARLEGQGMLSLLTDMEQPLTRVLFSMERLGFEVDAGTLRELGAQYTAEIESCRQKVYDLTGVAGFNLNSPKQLGEVLFDKLGLPAPKKSKSGGYSTAADVLEELAPYHPAIEPLLRYRKLAKLQGTYVEGLLRLSDRQGRVHTTFDQTATLTGRISSLEPNLQNIPIRTEEGRELRRAFVAREGCVLLDADYSQIELRVLAHLSGDEAMCDAFVRGQDIHTRTASEIHGVPMDAVTADMRRGAKAINFGIVYGISGFGLAHNTKISRKEADRFIALYFERYPLVRAFMDECVRLGHERGYAETMFRRRRALHELQSANRSVRAFGERAAMNTPVQGTAADIIKLAMVRVYDRLMAGGFAARLILQVHDELVVECPQREAEAVSALLRDTMETVVPLRVPLVAEVTAGRDWLAAH